MGQKDCPRCPGQTDVPGIPMSRADRCPGQTNVPGWDRKTVPNVPLKKGELEANLSSKHLKVMKDFENKKINVGDIVSCVDGDFKIIDLKYRNQYGTFILCEDVSWKKESQPESSWSIVRGVPVSKGNHYEIMGTIHIPGYTNPLGVSGFFVKNHLENNIIGLSYSETWEIIYKYGARNAEATRSLFPPLQTRIISTNDELPSFDSTYWKRTALNKEGKPHTPLSKLVLNEVEKAMIAEFPKVEENPFNINSVVVKEDWSNITPAEVEVQMLIKDFSEPVPSFYEEADEPEEMKEIKKITQLIVNAEKIVVLTGAGISTDSGILDYRSTVDRLWRKNSFVMADLNQKVFNTEPESFWKSYYTLIKKSLQNFTHNQRTYNSIVSTIKDIPTNYGHHFFAWLAKQSNKQVTILTENVDGLHKKAGRAKVLELYGNMFECICPSCKSTDTLHNVIIKNVLPRCMCGAILRPNLVLFGDSIHHFSEAIKEVEQAELILVVGTSLDVYPFNELVYHKNEDAKMILINESEVENEVDFDVSVLGNVTEICNELEEELIHKVIKI